MRRVKTRTVSWVLHHLAAMRTTATLALTLALALTLSLTLALALTLALTLGLN